MHRWRKMIKWVNVLFADHKAEVWGTRPKEGEEMKIQVLSDLHIEFEAITPMSIEQQARWIRMCETLADVVIAAGDTHTKGRGPAILAERFEGKQVICVAGNHEFYGEVYPHHLKKIQRHAEPFDNVHFLENQSVEIDDVVFLGCSLWTDIKLWESGPFAGLYNKPETVREIENCMNDYLRIKYFDGRRHRKLVPNDLVKVHLDSVRWLKEQFEIHKGKKIVVVTHQAPSFKSVPDRYRQDVLSAAYASHLDELVLQSEATLWVHGHTHEPCDYRIGKTRVICNPHGYPGENKWFRSDLVIDI